MTSQDFNGVAPEEIVFMPKGRHRISASWKGKPKLLEVEPSQELASMLASQLQESIDAAKTGVSSRPFIDFNHDLGRAAALPLEIGWDEERGIVARVEWTPSGRAAVEGKEFSYFSPMFAWDEKTKQITGLVQPGAIGGLVNTPAFQAQDPIAASLSTPTTTMDLSKLLELLKTYGIELSPESDMETMCAALDAKMKCMKPVSEVETVTAALNAANERIKTFEKAENERVTASATSFVDETITAGRITKESREHWLKLAVADIDGTKAILASFQPIEKTDGPPAAITITAGYNPTTHAKREELARQIGAESDPVKRAALYSEWSKL